MKIKVREGSDYLKGMLLIARRDRKIADSEIRLVKHVGAALGFDSRFCVDAIGEVLENKYLVDTPPEFSSAGPRKNLSETGLCWQLPTVKYIPPKKNGSSPRWRRMACVWHLRRRPSLAWKQ